MPKGSEKSFSFAPSSQNTFFDVNLVGWALSTKNNTSLPTNVRIPITQPIYPILCNFLRQKKKKKNTNVYAREK